MQKSRGLSVSGLCRHAQISRSGFYRRLSRPAKPLTRVERIVVRIFTSKNHKAGYRTIKMLAARHYGIEINHKKIRRIMREQRLFTLIRRRKKFNTYDERSRLANPFPDLVQRDFNAQEPDLIHSADITEVVFGNASKAYIFAAKDLGAKDIVSHSVASHPGVAPIAKAYRFRLGKLQRSGKSLIVHTDQGGQFFSDQFSKLVSKYQARQSMSRKGNCLDNAPIESFFGHMKDEVDFRACRNLEEVKRVVDRYVKFYNCKRPQWGLNKMTPAECRGLH